MKTSFIIVVCLFASACESGDSADGVVSSQTFSCEILLGNSCYKQALADIQLCASRDQGVLTPEASSCQTSDTEVVIHSPLREDASNVDFTVLRDGELCAEVMYQVDGPDMKITTASGTVTSRYENDQMSLTCPDGTTYRGHSWDLFSCEGAGSHFPGTSYVVANSALFFTLLGSGVPGDSAVQVVACQEPF